MIWFTADWHLGHHNIIKYANRPFQDVREMNNLILKNYKEMVQEDDDVYFLGDLTLCNRDQKSRIEKWINKLPGHKRLVLGNHDNLEPFTYLDIGFIQVCTHIILKSKFALIHDPAMGLCFPNKYILHGHIHNISKIIKKNYLNVGVDVWDFKPVSIEDIP